MTSLILPIHTDRLTLRTFERGDIEGLCAYHALPSVQRYVFSRTRDRTEIAGALKIMREHVSLQRPGDTLTLAVIRRGDQTLVGHVALRWSDAAAGQGEDRKSTRLNSSH